MSGFSHRVVVDCPGDPYHGERGKVLEHDPRLPTVLVELDRLPAGCVSPVMWFGDAQVRRLRPGEER